MNDDFEVRSVVDCPMAQMGKMWSSAFAMIRDEPGNKLILRRGTLITRREDGEIRLIVSLQWKKPTAYLKARKAGLQEGDKVYWKNVCDRRALVHIDFLKLMPLKKVRGHTSQPKYVIFKTIFVVQYGDKHLKAHFKESVKGRRYFRKWRMMKKKHTEFQITHWVSNKNDRPLKISAAERPMVKLFHDLSKSSSKLFTRSPRETVIMIGVGWDAFQSTAFGRRHHSSIGYYVHILNARHRLPSILYSVTDKDVPEHLVLKQLWKEVKALETERIGLQCWQYHDGTQEIRLCKWRVRLMMVTLDKEYLDPFQLSVRSAAENRCDGPWMRGSQEGLPCDDIQSLDARYLKDYATMKGERQKVLSKIVVKSQFDRVCREEGWSRMPYVDQWQPQSAGFNPLLSGVPDVMHTFHGLFRRMKVWLIKVFEVSHRGLWGKLTARLKAWMNVNHLPVPPDAFGRRHSEKGNMKLANQQMFMLWQCLRALQPDSGHLGCLKMTLDLLCQIYRCRSGNHVYKLQHTAKILLRELHARTTPEEDFNFPKTRAIITICFVTMPLFRNVAAWETARIESDHRNFKSILRNHWNWKDPHFASIQKFYARQFGWCYLERSGKVGSSLSKGLHPSFLELADPEHPDKPLFSLFQGARDWGEGSKAWLRCDAVGKMSDDRMLQERPELKEGLNTLVGQAGLEDIESCVSKRVSKIRFCSSDENCCADVSSPTWLTGRDDCGRYFVLHSECFFKVFKDEDEMIAGYGDVFLLNTDVTDTTMRARRENVAINERVGWFFEMEKRRPGQVKADGTVDYARSGGDDLGKMWVPGCSLLRTCVVSHIHKHGRSSMDSEGCGFREEFEEEKEGPMGIHRVPRLVWKCDTVLSKEWEVLDSEYLYQSRIWRNEPQRPTKENRLCRFDLSSFL